MTDNTLCACGCGITMNPLDKKGRPRKFIQGHAARVHKYNMISEYVIPNEKKCTICFKIQPIDLFYYKWYTSKTTGQKYARHRPECIYCSKEHTINYTKNNYDLIYAKKKDKRIENKNDIKYHVQEKISNWKRYSKNMGVISDLTVDYLVNLYNLQDGYCHYSKEKMIFGWVNGKVHHNTLSLDKLDPKLGYVKDNVVWCTYLINTMKQDMTDKEFYSFIQNILEKKIHER